MRRAMGVVIFLSTRVSDRCRAGVKSLVRTAIHAGVWSTDPDPDNVARVLAEVARIGYDGLALPLREPTRLDPEALARVFVSSGIVALGTTGLPPGADIASDDPNECKRGEAHLREIIALARDIGIRQIGGVFYGPLGHAAGPADVDASKRSAETMARVAEAASEAGIRLCVELVNRYESALLNTVEDGLAYLALVDHPNVRLHLDTYHLAIEERDPIAAIRAALPSLGYFELDQSHRGRLDEGALDLAAMAVPVRDGGYDGFIGVEAFARSRLAPQHANALAIWRDHFDDGTTLAVDAMAFIRSCF